MAEAGIQAWVDQESRLVVAGPRQAHSDGGAHPAAAELSVGKSKIPNADGPRRIANQAMVAGDFLVVWVSLVVAPEVHDQALRRPGGRRTELAVLAALRPRQPDGPLARPAGVRAEGRHDRIPAGRQ